MKIRENSSSEKSINLFHCLNELNDDSLVHEVQIYLSTTGDSQLSGVKPSPSQWSALVFVLLNSEEERDEFKLSKYHKWEECLLRLLPVIKASTQAEWVFYSVEYRTALIIIKLSKWPRPVVLNLGPGDPRSAHFVCLPYLSQFSSWSSLQMSWWSQSGVLNKGNMPNVQSRGSPGPGLITTGQDTFQETWKIVNCVKKHGHQFKLCTLIFLVLKFTFFKNCYCIIVQLILYTPILCNRLWVQLK